MEQKIEIKNKIKLLPEIEKLANIGIWTWDVAEDVVTWSDQLYKIYGVEPGDFKTGYENFLELVHFEERDYMDSEIRRSASKKQDFNLVHRIVRPDDGEVRIIHTTGKMTGKNSSGNVVMIGTSQDITERLHLEDELRAKEILEESENRLRVLLDQSPAPIVVIDALGKIIYASFTNEGIFGYSSDNLLGKSAFEFIHPADQGLVRRMLAQILVRSERILTTEFRIRHKEGTYRWVRAIGKNLLRNANVRGVVVNYVDITTNKRLEMATRELAAIVESSDDAIIGKTSSGIITNWNKGAEKMYGYTAKEIVGKPVKILAPKEFRREVGSSLQAVVSGETIAHLETKRIRKDGSLIDVSITMSPIRDSSGKIIGVSGIEKDITDRKTEERLKDEFIAALSHELRNPLAPILANIEFLQLEGIEDDKIREPVEAIKRQVKTIEIILNDLLNMVRITQGRLNLKKKKIDVRDVISNAVETTDSIMKQKEHKIFVKLPKDPLYIKADPVRIEQVIVNLLDNAAKYTNSGGSIRVKCTTSGKNVKILVRDDGKGITQGELDKIFELFIQGEQSLSRSKGGLGIGLSLVKKIVELHKGSVRVESKGRGKGSTFTVILPRVYN